MDRYTEIKCYMCSRVCGEIRSEYPRAHVSTAAARLTPGAFCEMNPGQLRCSRCGGAVHPADFYVEYSSTGGAVTVAEPPVLVEELASVT